MGNLFQRLFSNSSGEPGCKRPFSKHNKVNLNESNNNHNGGSKKSPSSPSGSQKRPVSSKPADPAPEQQQHQHENVHPEPELPPQSTTNTDPPANPEHSPFQRDFLPSHQPLVSLEKSRPRRSNIRRSSRMNTSMGKGDNVARPPTQQRHVLSTVPSFMADDDSVPAGLVNHSEQSASQSVEPNSVDNESTATPDTRRQSAANQSIVDEMAPNERHKVAKSRISQMFIKREQQLQLQHHKQMSTVTEADGAVAPTEANANGFVLNTDYVRVYESIDNYGHYKVSDTKGHEDGEEKEAADVHRGDESHGSSAAANNIADAEHDQPKVFSVHTSVESRDDSSGEQADESSKPELVVPRPKPKMMHGNPLLIDELKKRQSTLYQTVE